MNKEIYKPLFFWTVVILQIILISLYANTFYQSGCKVKEFTQNIKTIILSPQKLSEKSISEYANTLILVLGLTSLSLTIAFRPENVVFRKKKRKMVNSSKKVTESSIFLHGIKPVGKVNQDIIPAKETIEDKEKEKNLSISKEKEEEELPDKETVEQEEKKERKETENSEQEKNLSQTSTHHKEESEIKEEKEDEEEFQIPEVEVDISESELIEDTLAERYGPGHDEESIYDNQEFAFFFKKQEEPTEKEDEKASGAGGGENLRDQVRDAIREEMTGLIDETSFKMAENIERFNMIMGEIAAIRVEIKQNKGTLDSQEEELEDDSDSLQDKGLSDKIKKRKALEEEGRNLLDKIDQDMKIEAQSKYSQHSLIH